MVEKIQPESLAPQDLGRLRWRCRRGLLENDLLLERFFQRHGAALTQAHYRGLSVLMDLPDNELLDLLLRRKAPEGMLDIPDIHEVLALM